MPSKWKVSYEFRVSKRDRRSIARDLGIELEELTESDISNWVTQVLCGELADIRKSRSS